VVQSGCDGVYAYAPSLTTTPPNANATKCILTKAFWEREKAIVTRGEHIITTLADTKQTYVLDGTLLEACSCGGPCPCWVGDDPDGSRCYSFNAYQIDRGQVGGVDISNLSFVQVNQIPGNILAGNWRTVFYIDDRATPEQQEAILFPSLKTINGVASMGPVKIAWMKDSEGNLLSIAQFV
jgi:hypothetical protein